MIKSFIEKVKTVKTYTNLIYRNYCRLNKYLTSSKKSLYRVSIILERFYKLLILANISHKSSMFDNERNKILRVNSLN